MSLTNFPNGISTSHIVSAQTMNTTGNVYYVCNSSVYNGSDGNNGMSPTTPFRTLNYAAGRGLATRGDVIYIMPGHAETVSSAAAITLSVSGISVIGLGEGNNRPRFTFDTSTSASMVVSGNNIKLKNIIGIAGIDGLTKPFDVTGDNPEIDIEWQDASSTVEAATAVRLDTANNFKLKIKYLGFTAGNATVRAIAVDDCDNGLIDIDAYGVVSTAWVNFVDVASTNIFITGKTYTNGVTNSARNVVDTVGGSTWYAEIIDESAGKKVSGSSSSALFGASVNNLLGTRVTRSTADIISGSAVPVFTVTGTVLLTYLTGEVTTVIGAGANNAKFQFNPTTGTTNDMCANLDIDGDEVGALYSISGVAGDAMLRSESGAIRNMTANGVTLSAGQIEFITAANATGSIALTLFYIPITDGATVVAA